MRNGDHRRLPWGRRAIPVHRLPAGAARRGRDRRRLARARPLGTRQRVLSCTTYSSPNTARSGQRPAGTLPGAWPSRLSGIAGRGFLVSYRCRRWPSRSATARSTSPALAGGRVSRGV
jgi:hypothetical protein